MDLLTIGTENEAEKNYFLLSSDNERMNADDEKEHVSAFQSPSPFPDHNYLTGFSSGIFKRFFSSFRVDRRMNERKRKIMKLHPLDLLSMFNDDAALCF